MKPAQPGVVSLAMHSVLTPDDADALPGVVAVEPLDLRPFAIARALAPAQLTGGRQATVRALFGLVLAAGVLGAVASVSTGYHVHESGSGRLLEARAAGDAVSTIWCAAGAVLGLAGVALGGHRSARWLAAALVLLLAIMAVVVFATFSLDLNLDWDTYTIERWPAQALPIAIGTLASAGPVLLVAHWLLFRLERAHGP